MIVDRMWSAFGIKPCCVKGIRDKMKNKDYETVATVIEKIHMEYASTAIEQIKEKKYPEGLKQYTGNILLVGINYDKKTKKHECMIEEYHM